MYVRQNCLISHCHTDISELDEGLNPNPFTNNNYDQGHHIRTPWGSWSPSKESRTSSESREWFLMNARYICFNFKDINNQIVSSLQVESIGALKITHGCHNWNQEIPRWIRKALSGTFSIHYFLEIHICVVVYQFVCIFQDKSNAGFIFGQDCRIIFPPWINETPDHLPSGTFLIHWSFNLHIRVVYQILCIFFW